MNELSERDIPEMLDLLSAWQSTVAIAGSRHFNEHVADLNERTVALLSREVR